MNKLDYCKKLQETYTTLTLVADVFAKPISAMMQGYRFPFGQRNLLEEFGKSVHILDNRIINEPNNSEHNAIFAPIWEQINKEIVEPVEKLCKCLLAEDMGTSEGFSCINDYTKKLRELEETFKNIGAHAFQKCGYGCTHCKDGKCTGGFTTGEVKCDGVECCECYDSGCAELQSWH